MRAAGLFAAVRLGVTLAAFIPFAVAVGAVAPDGSTASFLRITPMARPAGMGNAYAGLAEGIESLHFNPAGLTTVERWDLGLAQIVRPLGARFSHLAAARRLSARTVGALQISYFGVEDEYRDAGGAATGRFTNYDVSPAVSLAHRLTPEVSLGGTVKVISSELAGYRASTLAGDFGVKYNPIRLPSVSLGASIHNVGPGMTYDQASSPLPWIARIGGAWRSARRHILASDLSVDQDGQPRLHLGGEFAAGEALALRGGLDFGADVELKDALKLGLGFRSTVGSFDYAYESIGEMGRVHRFSFSYLGGRIPAAEPEPGLFASGAVRSRGVVRVHLPAFQNLAAAGDADWLADGLREIFIARFARIDHLALATPPEAHYVMEGRYSVIDADELWVGVKIFKIEDRSLVAFREATIRQEALIEGANILAGAVIGALPAK